MTDIVSPPTIDAMPPAPQPTDTREQFNQKAFPHAAAQQTLVTQTNASAAATNQNAIAANERAMAAGAAAAAATQQADAAMDYRNQANSAATAAAALRDEAVASAIQSEASRIQASKLNLGDKTAPPATDNQGQPLRPGATYYDTTLSKWRVWAGSSWADGISAVAGVSSLNGETGGLVKNTLAGYGIQNFKIETSGNADLNTLLTSGVYRFLSTTPNMPPGAGNSVVTVSRGEDTGSQSVIDFSTGALLTRGFLDQGGGSVVWSNWRRPLLSNETAVQVSGTSLDLRLGAYFKDTVSANKIYSFSNQLPGSSFVLEVTHTGGAISFLSTVFPGSVAPSLTVNRRHLFFFQLPSLDNAWLCYCFANFPL
ncbi:pyocin knob domain-containing protein [Paracidovorax oryzae]|uniref:pyocin knob domain-containing protein n=1 Tax=Paracidovorax oryzae TaxID=862720 RepID=UPI000B117DE6|nr:pyocin knob domain-containing protein [Paracidovorax oryzae]